MEKVSWCVLEIWSHK